MSTAMDITTALVPTIVGMLPVIRDARCATDTSKHMAPGTDVRDAPNVAVVRRALSRAPTSARAVVPHRDIVDKTPKMRVSG